MDLTSHQTFSFPILKNSDIMQCMSEIGIDLTQDDLNEPHRHRDRVREVFLLLIEMGLGLTENDLRSPTKTLIERRDALPYPEMHEESLSELRFLRASMKFMKVCGLTDFGWKDLHAPTSKRFRRQLSGSINFARFREERMSLYDELTAQVRGAWRSRGADAGAFFTARPPLRPTPIVPSPSLRTPCRLARA